MNLALPSMQRDPGFTHAGLAWVVDAHMTAFGSFLLLAGRAGRAEQSGAWSLSSETLALGSRSVQVVLRTDQARALALALPETVEQDHHGRPSFRVGGRILATLWTARAMNVMAGKERIRAAAYERPDICTEVVWGKRLAAVRVDLERADPELLEDLLDHAWRAKAPARLQRQTR